MHKELTELILIDSTSIIVFTIQHPVSARVEKRDVLKTQDKGIRTYLRRQEKASLRPAPLKALEPERKLAIKLGIIFFSEI